MIVGKDFPVLINVKMFSDVSVCTEQVPVSIKDFIFECLSAVRERNPVACMLHFPEHSEQALKNIEISCSTCVPQVWREIEEYDGDPFFRKGFFPQGYMFQHTVCYGAYFFGKGHCFVAFFLRTGVDMRLGRSVELGHGNT